MYLKLIFTCTFDTFVARKLLLILKKCHMLQSNELFTCTQRLLVTFYNTGSDKTNVVQVLTPVGRHL